MKKSTIVIIILVVLLVVIFQTPDLVEMYAVTNLMESFIKADKFVSDVLSETEKEELKNSERTSWIALTRNEIKNLNDKIGEMTLFDKEGEKLLKVNVYRWDDNKLVFENLGRFLYQRS